MQKLYFYNWTRFLLFLSLSTVIIHQFHSYTKILTPIPLIPTLIPRVPTLILRILTLIPHIPIIPFIPLPDSPFQLLQIASVVSLELLVYWKRYFRFI